MEQEKKIELSESLEDYLEALYCIIDERKVARPKDIVNRLQVTNASVTGALRTLARHELIHYSPHDFVSFTEEGARIAEDIFHRHQRLRSFLTDILKVDPQEANATACKMEHIMSDDIIDRLVRLSELIKTCPRISEQKKGCERKKKCPLDVKSEFRDE